MWSDLTQHHRELYGDQTIGGSYPGRYFDQHLTRVGPEHIWVAEFRGTVVGLVGLIVEGEEAEVEPLAVRAEYRRRGIGRALLAHVTRQASKLEIRYLSIRPVARNRQAIALFHRAGFRRLGRVEMFTDLRADARSGQGPSIRFFGRRFGY